MPKRFQIVTKDQAGTIEVHRMKDWLRKHPEQLPPQCTPDNKTSHQLRSELCRMGWIVEETEHEVRLMKPDIAKAASANPVSSGASTELANDRIGRFRQFAADLQQLINRLQGLRASTNNLLPYLTKINDLVRSQAGSNRRRMDGTLSKSEMEFAQAEWESIQKEIDRLCLTLKEAEPNMHEFSADLENLLVRVPMNRELMELREEINSLRFPPTIAPHLKELDWSGTARLIPIIELRLRDMLREAWQASGISAQIERSRTSETKPLEVFCSYSHKDERFRKLLEAHLATLLRDGLISNWYDRKISPGMEWKNEIDSHLNNAGIILLLVSADFLASDYCHNIELKRALERHEEGSARVIPIILRDCDWKNSPIGRLQALPRNAKPVVSWQTRDSAFTDIVSEIRSVLKTLAASQAQHADTYFVAHPGPQNRNR